MGLYHASPLEWASLCSRMVHRPAMVDYHKQNQMFGQSIQSKLTRQQWGMAALALLLTLASVLLPQRVSAAPLSQEYTYAECSRADAAAVQAEMTALAQGVLVEGSSGLDIDALVATTWRTLGADATFDAAVDGAIARIQAERGYWERFWSGWSADKAGEFASQVAVYTFEDAALKAKLDEMSTAIANSLVIELQSAAAQSASSALLCLQSYVGEQYSATLFTAFQGSVTQGVTDDLDLSQSDNVQISPLEMHSKGLTGVGVIVATEITRRVAVALAEKLTGRLVGKIAGRVLGRIGSSVVPYVGWAVGVGLLVWDLWEGSQGALPTIRDALTTEEVKQEVRAEISAAVSEGLAAEIETLPTMMAATLVGQWQTFCAEYGTICQLAAENSTFRALLDNLPVVDLTRMVQLIDIFPTESTTPNANQAQSQLDRALTNGSFAKLLAAPPAANVILVGTGSTATTLAWVELAGEQLPTVVELHLYETIDPLRMSALSLATLLAIGDNAIIHKLRLLPTDQLLTLLQLSSADLAQVAAVASSVELGWLADYLAMLPEQEANAIAHELATGNMTIATLQAPPVAKSADSSAPSTDRPSSSVAAGDGEASRADSGSLLEPVTGMPEAVMTWWAAWPLSGVAVAAGVVILLLIAVGAALALRREMTNPPL